MIGFIDGVLSPVEVVVLKVVDLEAAALTLRRRGGKHEGARVPCCGTQIRLRGE
jgi:hypothetical protein